MRWRQIWLNSPYSRVPEHVAPTLDVLEEIFPITELIPVDDPESWRQYGRHHDISRKTISHWLTQAMVQGLITPRESAYLKTQLDI